MSQRSSCGLNRAGPTALLAAGLSVLATLPDQAVAEFGWHSRVGGVQWTLLSCHFVHLNLAHLAANLLALTALGLSAQWTGQSRLFAPLLVLSLLSVNLGLMTGPLPLDWYAGLSGALHGVFAGLLVRLALSREPPPVLRGLAGAGLIGLTIKLGLEMHDPAPLSTVLNIPVATAAHLYGAVGGVIAALYFVIKPVADCAARDGPA